MSKDKKKEDEEEKELVVFDPESPDPVTKERAKCVERECNTKKAFEELEKCTKRVQQKISYTAENCSQEMVDLFQAADKCALDAAFSKLV